jgi:superfamily II DNA or RNA helicase
VKSYRSFGRSNLVPGCSKRPGYLRSRAGIPRKELEAFLDAVRWGATTNADRSFLQAPFRSGISIEDYQLDPLVRAIDMARVNLLIADDVGLGKTIEAGLVVQELLVRHRARTVFIVCPASLQIKWQTEMREKFGLEFKIVDMAYIKQLRRERGIHANPWTSFPRLIASMDWMKSGEGYRSIKDVLPPQIKYPRTFDILIVDEAHNVSPATASRYALESQRTRLVRTIAPHFEHRLFLTATPHNGYQESFTSLLELLDDQRFARSVMPDEGQLRRVMVRRLKTDLVDSEGKPIYPKRVLKTLEVDYTPEEREIHRLLKAFTESRSKSDGHRPGIDFIHKLLKKRLFSSPMAFATTLARHRETLEGKRRRNSKATMDVRILHKAILRAEEDYADDELAEEAENDVVEMATEISDPLETEQRDMLDRLTKWAEKAKNRVDAKAEAILNWLDVYLKTDGEWNDKRVILFTEYRGTLVWLEQILTNHGFGGDRLSILHGGIDQDEREELKAAFQAKPSDAQVRILLATNAASEGIDLQNWCNYLIHIEIPWNPNVMEQRNGRIDRHGQRESEVFIWHPAGKGFDRNRDVANKKLGEIDGDHEYLMRAVRKVENIREDLGSVGPVIARQIEEAMLGRRKHLDTGAVEQKAASVRKFVKSERQLQEKISRLHEKLMEAKNDFHLSVDHISRAVLVGLELAEIPSLKPISRFGAHKDTVYDVPILPGTWGRAMAGLEHPHTHKRRPITFDHDLAKGRDDIVLCHLNHRFVQMCLRLLREELWKLDDVKKLHRVAFKSVADSVVDTPIVAVRSRLVITGSGHHLLHEEITLAGGELKQKGFARIPQISRLESIVEQANSIEPSQKIFQTMAERFNKNEESIIAAVEARSRERLRNLTNTLNRRMETEKKSISSVLDGLEKAIRTELKQENLLKQMDLPGFGEDERNQIRRDIEALKARLSRIPEEKKLEEKAIAKRYSGLADRTFPVSVEFLVPESQL